MEHVVVGGTLIVLVLVYIWWRKRRDREHFPGMWPNSAARDRTMLWLGVTATFAVVAVVALGSLFLGIVTP